MSKEIQSIFQKLGDSKKNLKRTNPFIDDNLKEEEIKELKLLKNKKINIDTTVLYDKMNDNLSGIPYGSQKIKELINDSPTYNEKIEKNNFLIEKYQKKLKLNPIKKNELSDRKFGKKLMKQLNYSDIPADLADYNLYLPLNNLWNKYMNDLLENEKNEESFFSKLIKADFHGAILKVLQAKCKTYEGQSGIIIKETNKTFKIVTKQNRIVLILKQNCIFLFEILNKVVKLYGCHLQIRPSERARFEFKMKEANDFIYSNIKI